MAITSNTVWIAMSCSELANKIRELSDKGFFSEVKSLTYQAQAFLDKIASFAQEHGGHLHINLPDRQILELDEDSAEELPNIIEGYKAQVSSNIACGLGLSFDEASSAMRVSMQSDEIEMFNPEDERFSGVVYYKSENGSDFILPPNLFDPMTPPPKYVQPEKPKYVPRPAAQQELQAEGQLVQAIAQSMMPPPPSPEQMQQQQPPQDLREALHGGRVPGHTPKEEDEKENKPKKKELKESDDKESDDSEEESNGTNEKLKDLLSSVNSSLPGILSLHDKNPEAYKQALSLIHKLVQVAHDRKKVSKAEAIEQSESITEDLNKAIRLRLPVGTLKDRKKKVLVNGKEVWRSVASGLTMDPAGEAISVKSHNATAAQGGDPSASKGTAGAKS